MHCKNLLLIEVVHPYFIRLLWNCMRVSLWKRWNGRCISSYAPRYFCKHNRIDWDVACLKFIFSLFSSKCTVCIVALLLQTVIPSLQLAIIFSCEQIILIFLFLITSINFLLLNLRKSVWPNFNWHFGPFSYMNFQ